MKPEFTIRDYRPDDFVRIEALWREVGMAGRRRGDGADVVARTLTYPGARFLILESVETAGLMGTSWMTCDGRRIHLHHFAIKPSHQGRGLSHLLLRASLRHVKQVGFQVKLEVRRDNERAIDLYRKSGFETIGDYEVYILRDLSIII